MSIKDDFLKALKNRAYPLRDCGLCFTTLVVFTFDDGFGYDVYIDTNCDCVTYRTIPEKVGLDYLDLLIEREEDKVFEFIQENL